MFVTLYTDASWSTTSSKGGWGVWCRSDAGRLVKSGAVFEKCRDCNEAELYAIQMGIEVILNEWPQTSVICVRSDSKTALRALETASCWSENANLLLKAITRRSCGVTLRTKWVKGHQFGGTTQGWLNNAVDGLAKRARLNKS